VKRFPTFEDFFEDLVGYQPFRWQSRLASFIIDNGRWPAEIGVPTGLGKSSTVEIAIWSLALQAASDATRTLPTRVWYVVNRRLLVDEAFERALRLQDALRTARDGPLGRVAEALYSAQAVRWDSGPLHVARIRGGADGGFRPPDPSCPAVMLATVPMFGSRLFFRGYGTGTRMRSVDAALAGTDSLLLLDEAHIARPLIKALHQRQELPAGEAEVLPAQRRDVARVSLTATGAIDPEFTLDATLGDHDDEIVVKRISATKSTELASGPKKKIHEQLATTAFGLAERLLDEQVTPAVCLFVNTAGRAARVKTHVDKLIKKWDHPAESLILTGRLRSIDAAPIRDRLLGGSDNVRAGRSGKRDRTLFVVATQTLEVGADLDFDAMVTESAGARALVQRFGRLNRLGDRNYSLATIVHAEDEKSWPVYGAEPAEVWNRLLEVVGLDESSIDLGPERIGNILGEPTDLPPRSPELLPNHLREWAKTSPPANAWEAPVDPFISGENDDDRRVSVLWRNHLPRDGAENHHRLLPLPHTDETVEIPIGEFVGFANERKCRVLNTDDGTLDAVLPHQLRPGATIVLPGEWGGYRADLGWSADSTEPTSDASASLRREFVVSGRSIRTLADDDFLSIPADEVDTLAELADSAQAHWSERVWVDGGAEDNDDALAGLRVSLPALVFVRRRGGPLIGQLPATTNGVKPQPPRAEIDDELSTITTLAGERATLAAHLALVGDTAHRIAKRIGLTDGLADAVALAARVHDVGKCDPRFQLLLGAEPDVLMAKSDPGHRAGASPWPRGGRHEAISGRLFTAWMADNALTGVDADLVHHLVLSHHGFGRPLVPGVYSAGALPIQFEVEGQSVEATADLADVDWEQPARFERLNKRYGPWCLALLEAVLRQADHAESALADNGVAQVTEIR